MTQKGGMVENTLIQTKFLEMLSNLSGLVGTAARKCKEELCLNLHQLLY
jgi:hypothetical protein